MERSGSMHKSWEVQNEASALGFDWSNISDVIKKVKEEIEEIEEALGRQDTKHAAEELGDLFFASVNLARFLDVHPSDVMHAANTKFSRRFSQVKAIVDARNLDMRRCSLKDLDAIWDEVKRREHGEKK